MEEGQRDPSNKTERMDLIQGAKVLSERFGKREATPIAVAVVANPIPEGALPLFSWFGVVRPALEDTKD